MQSIKKRVIYCNIYIAVFYCDSVGTTSEKLYWNLVALKQVLYALEGYNTALVIFIGLLRNCIWHLLQLFWELRKRYLSEDLNRAGRNWLRTMRKILFRRLFSWDLRILFKLSSACSYLFWFVLELAFNTSLFSLLRVELLSSRSLMRWFYLGLSLIECIRKQVSFLFSLISLVRLDTCCLSGFPILLTLGLGTLFLFLFLWIVIPILSVLSFLTISGYFLAFARDCLSHQLLKNKLMIKC